MEHSGLSARMMGVLAAMPVPSSDSEPTDHEKIDLSKSENWLLRAELLDIGKKAIADNLTTEDLCYSKGFGGDPALLKALAAFFNNYFNPSFPVAPDQISTQAGSGNSLDALAFSIFDDGDSVLMPGPTWWGYGPYFAVRSHVNIVVAEAPKFRDSLSMDCVSRLEAAYDAAQDKNRIKALLITNPHNPGMDCYSPEVLRKLMSFCHKRGIHYISDEVHALCIHPSTTFTSALSLLDKPADGETEIIDRSRVHVVWSTSKDFGSPGVRLACVVSQANPAAIAAITLSSFWQTSVLSSVYFTGVLTSPELPTLVKLNSQRLATSYQILIKALREWDVEYIPATAGTMIFVKALKHATSWEEEEKVVEKFSENGVIVLPGKQFGIDGEIGWVKVLVAIPEDTMREVVKRMGRVLRTTA